MPSACQLARARLTRLVQAQRDASASEKAADVVKASYLASVRTPLRAVGGNLSFGGIRHLVAQPLEAAFDYMQALAKSAKSGGKIKPHELRQVVNALDVDGLKTLVRGFKEGSGSVGDAFRATKGQGWTAAHVRNFVDELSVSLQADQAGSVLQHARIAYKSPVAQALTDIAYAMPEIADRGFWKAAYDYSMYMQSKLNAVREGATGARLKQRSAYYLANPTEEMAFRALEDAIYATFKDKTRLGSAASNLKQGLMREAQKEPTAPAGTYEHGAQKVTQRGAQVASFIVDTQIAPFVNVPSSVAAKSVAMSPLGILSPKMLGNQASRARALANTSIGAAMWYAGMQLYKEGKITLGPDREKAQRNVQQARGIPNWSIKIGDHYMPALWLGPAAIPLFAGGLVARSSEESDKSAAEKVGEGAQGIGQMMLEQTYLDGLKRIFDTMSGDRKASSMVSDLVPVPPLVRQAAQATDATVRDPQNIAETLAAQIPGLSRTVPARTDILGREIRRSPLEQVTGVVSPVTIKTPTDSPALAEIARLGVGLSSPTRRTSYKGEKFEMSDEDVRLLQSQRGQVWSRAFAALIESPEYQALPDEQRIRMIERVRDKLNAAARAPITTRAIVAGLRARAGTR